MKGDQPNSLFDWGGFKSVLDDQEPESVNIGDFNGTPIPLQGDNASVSTLVGKVSDLLPNLLPDDLKYSGLKSQLTSSLKDLDGLWEDQSKVPDEKSLTREYRAIVGVPSDKPDYLSTVVATVKVVGHYKAEKGGFGGIGKPKITKELNASISVLGLVVVKSFTSPS